MDSFDARTVPPSQGGEAHPPGIFDFQITNTLAKSTKDGNNGLFVVEFTSPSGRMENNYNLFRQNDKAQEIAQKELSALCHAVNIYKITFPKNADGSMAYDKAGFELRGGRGRMEIAPQMRKGSDGKLEPTGYMEIKKIFDSQGNEPGRGTTQQPTPQQPAQPAPAQQNAPMQQNNNGGWGNPNQAAPAQPPQQNNNSGGWSQNANPNPTPAGTPPPWGK